MDSGHGWCFYSHFKALMFNGFKVLRTGKSKTSLDMIWSKPRQHIIVQLEPIPMVNGLLATEAGLGDNRTKYLERSLRLSTS